MVYTRAESSSLVPGGAVSNRKLGYFTTRHALPCTFDETGIATQHRRRWTAGTSWLLPSRACRTQSPFASNPQQLVPARGETFKMPTSLHHPQARFDPIPPDLDLHALVDQTPNFEWVLRISTAQIQNLSLHEFEKLVHLHVITGGKPLVISGWNEVLPSHLFSAEWLEVTYDKKRKCSESLWL